MISDSVQFVLPPSQQRPRTIRPIAASSLRGIVFDGDYLIAIDTKSGYLLKIDVNSHNTEILNPDRWEEFIGVTGIAIAGDRLWFTSGNNICYCDFKNRDFTPKIFAQSSYPANGIAVCPSTIYVSSQKSGHIFVYSQETHKEITRFYAPGIGMENLAIRGEELWVSDTLEQTVYCLDRATGAIQYSVLTPFESPTGLAFFLDPLTAEETLYVAYEFQEPYIRDNPNAEPNHELNYRPRSFVHPLYFHFYSDRHYALSNGYLIEMTYVEELAPLDPIDLKNLEWRIALPADTPRQKVRQVEAIGMPFEIQEQDGQKIAVFKFDQLTETNRCIFGWKATLEVWGIKYRLTPKDCENIPPLPSDFGDRYLIDNDDLAMNTEIIKRAAVEAAARETNPLRKMFAIRNYVYDRLSYGIKPHIDTPDIALRRGTGSCGEYVGVLLALTRLNGIACRTVGRYKCPPLPLMRNLPLEPDYNHVWMEFYLPTIGWLPMESNPDDLNEGGPYPMRFFMGLAWYHAEVAKDVPFETVLCNGIPLNKQVVSIGDLAINHVLFNIVDELKPSP